MNLPTDMQVSLCGVTFANPVIAASGTFGFGTEYLPYVNPEHIGGICLKALTKEPREGNRPVRIAETPAGVLNSIGLQNPGVAAFRDRIYPQVRDLPTRKIANVAGSTPEEYLEVIEVLDTLDIDMYELNVSCPNVRAGGMTFGKDPQVVFSLTRRVREMTEKPLIVKLTPNTGDIVEQARAARDGGADALSLINTLLAMAVDVRSRRAVLANVTGGLSGPAVMPVALRMVHEVYCADLGLPIIGMGGICTGEDAAAFLICGADAVMVGTATLRSPDAVATVARELEEQAGEMQLESIRQLTGTLIKED